MIRDLTDPAVDAVIERHQRYWFNQEIDPDVSADVGSTAAARPLCRFGSAHPLSDTPDPHVLEPPPLLNQQSFRENTERTYDEQGLLTDDLFRAVATGFASEVLVGCRMFVRAGTHWAENCLEDWRQLDAYRVQETIWYQRLMENTKRAVEAVDDSRYPFCCMAYRGAVDMAEAMMGGERLCTAVIDNPRELKNLLGRITDITIETAVAHGALLPSHGGGQFNSYGIWTPGNTVTFTLDGGCLFSPACYEEFFLPCDQRLCEAFETPFVHLHAAARQHFPAWTEIDNLGLQCVIDQAWLDEEGNLPIGPQLGELLADFKRIRERKSLMMYGYWNEQLIDLAMAELPVGGCSIDGMVDDEEAIRRRYCEPESN